MGPRAEYEAPIVWGLFEESGDVVVSGLRLVDVRALLFAFSYNRIYTVWPMPFGKESIINATVMTACLLSSSLTMVLGVIGGKAWRSRLDTKLDSGDDGVWYGVYRAAWHGVDSLDPRWTHLAGISKIGGARRGEYAKISRACRSLPRHSSD